MEEKFDQNEMIGKDDPCPHCGADGRSHITISIVNILGRKCSCGWTWPIRLDEDNPKIDHNKTVMTDEFLSMVDKISEDIKRFVSLGISVNIQIDRSKLKTENKIVIRYIIEFNKQAPTVQEAFPNPFDELPECEEPKEE